MVNYCILLQSSMQCWVQINNAEIENLDLYRLIVNQMVDTHWLF